MRGLRSLSTCSPKRMNSSMGEIMEEVVNIYQRMHRVMKAVSYVQKEDKKVNNQYTFVSHDAVTAKIRPALIENGIITVPRVVRWAQDGNRTEANVEVDFVNIDKPDEKITVPMFGFGIDPQDKGPGKAISYAVKYALLKAFSLETGDDPEKDAIDYKPVVKNIAQNIDQEVALATVPPEVLGDIRREAKAIEGDFYTLSVKAAVERYNAFKGMANAEEIEALWSFLDSKVRNGMKRFKEGVAA